MVDIVQQLQQAIRDDDRAVSTIARAAGVTPIGLWRFLNGERDVRMATAAKVAAVLGLELKPTRRRKAKGGS